MEHFKIVKKGNVGECPQMTVHVKNDMQYEFHRYNSWTNAICQTNYNSANGLLGAELPTRFSRGDASVQISFGKMPYEKITTKQIGEEILLRAKIVDETFKEKYPAINEEWSSDNNRESSKIFVVRFEEQIF